MAYLTFRYHLLLARTTLLFDKEILTGSSGLLKSDRALIRGILNLLSRSMTFKIAKNSAFVCDFLGMFRDSVSLI